MNGCPYVWMLGNVASKSQEVRRIFTADIVLESTVDNKMTLQVVRFIMFTAA